MPTINESEQPPERKPETKIEHKVSSNSLLEMANHVDQRRGRGRDPSSPGPRDDDDDDAK